MPADPNGEAQVVYERQPGGDLRNGPCEFVRVGVRFGDRVIWLGSSFAPGDGDDDQYVRDIVLAQEIVFRWKKGKPLA